MIRNILKRVHAHIIFIIFVLMQKISINLEAFNVDNIIGIHKYDIK